MDLRKQIRSKMLACLSHETAGFNANLAAIAAGYGITAFEIDWATGSASFLQSQLVAPGIEDSRLTADVRVVMYTGPARSNNPQRAKSRRFDGQITGNLDFVVMPRSGEASLAELTEGYADAIDDAVLDCLHDVTAVPVKANFHGGSILYAGNMISARRPVEQLSNGFRQILQYQFTYEVMV